MAIERRWINWATAISCAILLVFCLAQVAISFYLNLVGADLAKRQVTGASLVSLSLVLFPSIWVGFCAAISRHRGVYIALTVLLSLSILDVIGNLTYQAYEFNRVEGFIDGEKAFAITIVVLQSLILLILFLCLGFACAALCYQANRGRDRKYGSHPRSPPNYYSSNDGYRMSVPPPGVWESYGPVERGYERPQERVYYTKGRY